MLFNIDEKQLMLELKNKDERALKICMNKYYRYVVYIVENIIGSALPYEDKEEVVSNVFVALWNYSADLDTDNYSTFKPLKFTYRTAIIVTVVSVFLCMPVYAAISHLLTSALIDDSNRHLIGTETNDRSYIILKDGVYTNEKGKVVDIEELAKSSSEFPESRIVKSSLMPNFIPSSIVEIPTDKSDEMYIIPEIILINNSLCVLTQDNGKGWELTDKDNIVISFDKYKSDITVSQDLIIGYVKDGIMYEGEVFDELSGKYSFSPDEKGEYFFYLLSGSSDYLSLKSGNLEVN